MIISHKHKFIFLKTRKVAGSSVELAISDLCGAEDVITPLEEESSRQHGMGAQNYRLPFRQWPMSGKLRRLVGAKVTDRRAGYYGHISATETRRFLGDELFDQYFKFSIERNPWDRQVSQYYWETKSLANRPDFSAYVHGSFKHKIIPNFDIYSHDGKVCADFLIRYENLEADLKQAIQFAGIDRAEIVLPRAKSGIRCPTTGYRDHYNAETKALVAKWYEREIDHFGYTF